MDEPIPKFCPGRVIRARVAPVSLRTLRGWAVKGYVRTAKLGGNRQSPVLYATEDVIDVLGRYAEGRLPVRRRVR